MCVRYSQAAHEFREVVITPTFRPANKVPMIWHQAEGEQSNRYPVQCFDYDAFESSVVRVVMKDRLSPRASIENVEDIANRTNSFPTWHDNSGRMEGVPRIGSYASEFTFCRCEVNMLIRALMCLT